jgi:ABC-2 type transport system ATP-binding protein
MIESARASTPLLAFEALTVRYGRTTAVDRVSLEVGKGEVYALLGRNGSGKTSMIRCLLGQRKASGGAARLFGEDAWRARATAMARIGVVPEEPDAPPAMTASQLAAFGRRLYGAWDEKGVFDRLRRFRVPTDLPFQRLSKGQKGQLALTLALAPLPDLLVLDDPTLGLDAVARKELFEELVGELADRGTTVFLTSHDLAGVEGIADRVGILREGRLLLDEKLETLKERFKTLRWASDPSAAGDLLSPMEPLRMTATGWGAEAVVQRFNEEAASALAEGAGRELESSPMSLEEIFIALTGEEVDHHA